jgi:CHAT domain-containing protein/tetratricopeptide (TPR) repeat protein
MDQDELLKKLGQLGRARDPTSDPRWEALSAGALSKEEAEALRRESEATEEGKRLHALFQPLEPEARQRSFDQVMAKLELERKGDKPPRDGEKAKRPFLARKVFAGAALAMAASIALFLTTRAPVVEPSVVAYSMVAHGEQSTRALPGPSDDSAPLRLSSPGSRLELRLDPIRGIESPKVKLLLLGEGTIHPISFALTLAPNGSLSISGTKEELFPGIPPGSYQLVVAVGGADSLPDDGAIAAEAKSVPATTSKRGYTVLHRPLELIGGASRTLDVEFSRCAAVRKVGAEIVCELPSSRSIQLWVSPPEAVVSIDEKGRPPPGKAVSGGLLYTLESIPEDAKRIEIVLETGREALRRTVVLAPERRDETLAEAQRLRRDPATRTQAKALLTPLLDDPRPEIRALARGVLSRIELSLGETERAIDGLQKALVDDREAGLVSAEMDDRLALSYAFSFNGPGHQPNFHAARKVLEEGEPLTRLYPEGRVLKPYYLGLIERETGDLRAALALLDEAARGAERLGLDPERSDAQRVTANVLASLGRPEEALSIFRAIERAPSRGADTCAEEKFANDFGWFAIGAAESGRGPALGAPDPVPLLKKALEGFRAHCPSPEAESHVLGNLSIATLEQGDVEAARAFLVKAREVLPTPDARVEVGYLLVEAKIALRGDHPDEALRAYDRLAELARRAGLRSYDVEAALGRAQAFDAQGRWDDAQKAYAAADALLYERSLRVPIGEGKEGFLARHERAARLRVDFLLRRAEADPATATAMLREAMRSARRARARILTALQWVDRVDSLPPEERRAFREAIGSYRDKRALLDAGGEKHLAPGTRQRELDRALDEALARVGGAMDGAAPELPEPAEGELLLVVHPLREGWVGFALRDGTIHARRLGAIDPSADKKALATALLSPFEDRLKGARRLRVALHGALGSIDVHALPWGKDSAPLLASIPVVYGVDVPQAQRAPAAPGPRPLALVISDPGEDLPLAREEGSAMIRALEARSYRVEKLHGRDASYEKVHALLEAPGAELLHYSAHGHFESRHDGLGSGLGLSAHQWLSAGDILALQRAPRRVILTGCETARTSSGASSQGLGLAQAFLAAGAEVVLASTRIVDDHLALRLVSAMIEGAPSFPSDLGKALQEAQLSLARERPRARLGDLSCPRALSGRAGEVSAQRDARWPRGEAHARRSSAQNHRDRPFALFSKSLFET